MYGNARQVFTFIVTLQTAVSCAVLFTVLDVKKDI